QAQVHGAKCGRRQGLAHRLADLVVITLEHATIATAACGTRETLEQQSVDGFVRRVGGVDRDLGGERAPSYREHIEQGARSCGEKMDVPHHSLSERELGR